jgi:hypothetical protein
MSSTFKIVLGAILSIALLVPSAAKPSPVAAGGYCDWAQFVTDVSVPDGWPVYPSQVFRKTWRLKNIGTCTWTRSYSLVFAGGEQMGGLSAVNLPKDVPPGQSVDVSVDLTAPALPGMYRGYWQLRNPSGGLFGIGPSATNAIWVQVEVTGRSFVVYDFAANMCSANWQSEWGGNLPCTGVIPDERGVVMKLDQPTLENGSPATAPGILMIPPFEYNESIYGIYPPMQVQFGDQFQSMIGCEYGASGCEVQFVIKYKIEGEPAFARTYWNSFEKNDGTFRKLNLSLNGLAGKNVSLLLMIRPLGETTKDRALWVNPVIVRPGAPVTPGPTSIPLPSTPMPVPTAGTVPAGTKCDKASFVADITVPDGTIFSPSQQFTKTWRLKNNGTCTWTTGYSIVFSSGEPMSGPASLALPNSVAPGQTIDISLNLTAPANPGTYRGYWLLKNAAGGLFGIGSAGNAAFWLEIKTSGVPASGTGYDFAANACQAAWSSGAGVLPCPGTPGSTKGYGMSVSNPVLENNTTDSRMGILMVPQNVYNGSIQAAFPPFTVQSGDRFQSTINCEFNTKGCYVVFRLDYQVNNGTQKTLWSFGEKYEGLYYQADVDLSSLAGQNVQFILYVGSAGSPANDRALWVGPRILRAGVSLPASPAAGSPTSTPLPTPTNSTSVTMTPVSVATSTPVPSPVSVDPSWSMYQNTVYNFAFRFPPGTSISGSSAEKTLFNLPITPGTSLLEKYLQVDVRPYGGSCTNPFGWMPNASSNFNINGIDFLFESGSVVTVDRLNDWRSYSVPRNGNCISLTFVLVSNASGAPAPFNQQSESAVFDTILSTFGWTSP